MGKCLSCSSFSLFCVIWSAWNFLGILLAFPSFCGYFVFKFIIFIASKEIWLHSNYLFIQQRFISNARAQWHLHSVRIGLIFVFLPKHFPRRFELSMFINCRNLRIKSREFDSRLSSIFIYSSSVWKMSTFEKKYY